MIKHKLTLLFILCCSALQVMGQVVLQPVPAAQKKSAEGATAALGLPFFDDFSGAGSTPNTANWQKSGGVYVNDRYGYMPISSRVASFDGLNAAGTPYVENAVGSGPSDTLTSQPFLFGSLQPSDSVYLSFYWQSGGMGNEPDQTKENAFYQQLEFKDATGNWIQVWRQNGVGGRTSFNQVFIPVKDAHYFHNGFQFRFRNVGSRNRMADIWNIDYVELDKNRRKGQIKSQDVSISQGVSRLLKNYTAMPVGQFLANPQAALSDSVWVSIHKLGLLGAINWRGYVKRANAAPADTFLRDQGIIRGSAFTVLSGKPRIDKVGLPGEGFVLQHGFVLNTSEVNARQRANDTTSRKTVFADYYAFDDGTAEETYSIVSSAASHQVAQRIDLQKPDQVRGFLASFPRLKDDLSNTSLTFKVWRNENGLPGEVLYQESFKIQHSNTPDTFFEVLLTKPVAVQESFFYGWSQPGSLKVHIGFDRNEDSGKQRFIWGNYTKWQSDSLTQGSVMMRVLMAGMALGLEDELPVEAVTLYPNPTTGTLHIAGNYKQIQLFDLLGRQVFEHTARGPSQPLDLSHLTNGAYIARILTTRSIITKKIIITR